MKFVKIQRIKGKIKNRLYLYKTGIYNFNSLIASVNSFYSLDKNFTERCFIIEKM